MDNNLITYGRPLCLRVPYYVYVPYIYSSSLRNREKLVQLYYLEK